MSDDYTRPGPLTIDPNQAVGGIVVHIYSVPDCDLLHVGRMSGAMTAQEADALIVADVTAAAEAIADHNTVCIVMFDGDSGERISHWPDPWN